VIKLMKRLIRRLKMKALMKRRKRKKVVNNLL